MSCLQGLFLSVVWGDLDRVTVSPSTTPFGMRAINLAIPWNKLRGEDPFYQTISDDNVTDMKSMGVNVVRLGVMMPGVFRAKIKGPTQRIFSRYETWSTSCGKVAYSL